MAHKYAEIAFTPSVRAVQRALGSRSAYDAMDGGEASNHVLGEREAGFIATRDSLYIASVSETGWPYVQHRGGPSGFVRVLDEATIGFADFRGNRQYVTVGNVRKDDRVSLFLMDYPGRTRLKIFGRVRLVGAGEAELLARLQSPGYDAPVERGFLVRVEAFDWNCPQHITPRFTQAEVDAMLASLLEENRALRSVARRRGAATQAVLGDGPLELAVRAVRELTPRIRAYELRAAHGGELPRIEAGAHLQVPVPLDDGETGIRCYSICSDPASRDAWEIAVLREDEGTGGSRAVHERFQVGQRLRCAHPRNDFALHSDARPAVLIAGGIGITPIMAMVRALQARGNAFELHYAGRSAGEMAFGERLSHELDGRLSMYRSAEGERMDIERVLAAAPHDALFYVCGPSRLADGVASAAAARGIAAERIRLERFGAAVAPDARPIELELRRSSRRLRVGPQETVLEAMLGAGVDAPYGCRAGQCKSCAVEVLDGEPEHRDSCLSPSERDGGWMTPCVSRAAGDRLVLDA